MLRQQKSKAKVKMPEPRFATLELEMARLDLRMNPMDPMFPEASEPPPVAPPSIPAVISTPPSAEVEMNEPADQASDVDSAAGEVPSEPDDFHIDQDEEERNYLNSRPAV
jgi:hypothetical protein